MYKIYNLTKPGMSYNNDSIENIIDYVNWINITVSHDIDMDFGIKYRDRIDLPFISINGNINNEVLLHFADDIGWNRMYFNKPIKVDLIKKYEDKIDWESLSRRLHLHIHVDIIDAYRDKIVWHLISTTNADENLIEKYKNYFDHGFKNI